MAIPDWTWAGDDAGSQTGFDAGSVADASETFAVLADETRLAILRALADAESPVAYTDLRTATGVADNGRLNYHLRQLRPEFVTGDGAGYALTDRGRAVVDTALPT